MVRMTWGTTENMDADPAKIFFKSKSPGDKLWSLYFNGASSAIGCFKNNNHIIEHLLYARHFSKHFT